MTAESWLGQTIASRYRVDALLGKGGMGVVVRARHIHLDEVVAIKLLLPEMLTVQGMVTRFLREARAASKIKSHHVVRVTDVDVLESGIPYMVMEYLDGVSLAAVRRRQGRLEVAEAVRCLLQACEAIAEAHSLGIIHRDLKPANLFLARCGDGTTELKVLDFGISKIEGPDELEATKTGQIDGLAQVHVARADALGARRRRAHRHLVAGCHPLRARRRARALPRRDDAAPVRAGAARLASGAARSQPRPPRRARGHHSPLSRARRGEALRERGRAGDRAQALQPGRDAPSPPRHPQHRAAVRRALVRAAAARGRLARATGRDRIPVPRGDVDPRGGSPGHALRSRERGGRVPPHHRQRLRAATPPQHRAHRSRGSEPGRRRAASALRPRRATRRTGAPNRRRARRSACAAGAGARRRRSRDRGAAIRRESRRGRPPASPPTGERGPQDFTAQSSGYRLHDPFGGKRR